MGRHPAPRCEDVPHAACLPRQAAARRRPDVRRRRQPLRRDQRRPLPRPGPAVASRHRRGLRGRSGPGGPRHRRRDRDEQRAVRRLRRRGRPCRLLARDAARGSPPPVRPRFHGGRRDAAPVRRRGVRRRDDELRAAQRLGPRRRAARVPPCHQAGRAPRRLRVQPPDQQRLPHRLLAVPRAQPAGDRAPGQEVAHGVALTGCSCRSPRHRTARCREDRCSRRGPAHRDLRT